MTWRQTRPRDRVTSAVCSDRSTCPYHFSLSFPLTPSLPSARPPASPPSLPHSLPPSLPPSLHPSPFVISSLYPYTQFISLNITPLHDISNAPSPSSLPLSSLFESTSPSLHTVVPFFQHSRLLVSVISTPSQLLSATITFYGTHPCGPFTLL